MNKVLSNIYIDIELAKDHLYKVKSFSGTFENIMKSEAPSFRNKKFLGIEDINRVDQIEDKLDNISVKTEQDILKIKNLLLEWNHAVSGLKKYIMDILSGIRKIKRVMGKLTEEEKKEILEERSRIEQDLLEIAMEVEQTISLKLNSISKYKREFEHLFPDLNKLYKNYTKHLEKANELVDPDLFKKIMASQLSLADIVSLVKKELN